MIAGTGSLGTSNNAFQYPSDLVSDPSTSYITDTSNNRVMHYSFKASAGTIFADGNGARPNNTQLNLYVTASTNDRVQKFNRY